MHREKGDWEKLSGAALAYFALGRLEDSHKDEPRLNFDSEVRYEARLTLLSTAVWDSLWPVQMKDLYARRFVEHELIIGERLVNIQFDDI